MGDGLPLNALLGQPLAAAALAYDPTGKGPSLGMWSNVLRLVGDGVTERELVTAARLSKRVAKVGLNGATKRGWLEQDGKTFRLTATGRSFGPPDERWPGLISPLRALVEQLPLEWPHFPVGYGSADLSATGGPYVAGVPDNDIPPHGTDWKPVMREGDTTDDIGVTALLSQALMQFTSDFELLRLGPLYYAANVLWRLPDEGRPIKEFPDLGSRPGNGKSVLERHLYITISGKPKVAAPTPRGQNTRNRYADAVAAAEQRWRDRYGDGVITDVRGALESIDVDRTLPHHIVGSLLGYPTR